MGRTEGMEEEEEEEEEGAAFILRKLLYAPLFFCREQKSILLGVEEESGLWRG